MILSAALAFASAVSSTADAAIVSLSSYFNPTNTTANWQVGFNLTSSTGPFVAGTPGLINSDIPGLWASQPANTWINDGTGNSVRSQGWYRYAQSFILPDQLGVPNGSAVTPLTPFGFSVAADNELQVFVNGVSVYASVGNAFSPLVNISGFALNSGLNTISFLILNTQPADGSSPTGLHVSGIKGSYDDEQPPPPIPEPASLLLWGGLGGLGLAIRFRKKFAVKR
jgi:hypothetical protein